jgi:hypothetical protein
MSPVSRPSVALSHPVFDAVSRWVVYMVDCKYTARVARCCWRVRHPPLTGCLGIVRLHHNGRV